LRRHLTHEPHRVLEKLERLLQIDDVDAIAFAKMYSFIFGFQRLVWCPK